MEAVISAPRNLSVIDRKSVVVCDLSASPYLDLAGARMLHALYDELAARGIVLQIVGARGRVRDLLRADGLAEKVGGLERAVSLDDAISAARKQVAETTPVPGFLLLIALKPPDDGYLGPVQGRTA
jgi:MFS superfamily sulfate permease-like transporter